MEFTEIYQQYMYSYPHKTAYRKLTDIQITDYLLPALQEPLSLYFHIPFCESKCGYCNLFSVTGQTETFISQYLDAMEHHMQYLLYAKQTDSSLMTMDSIQSRNPPTNSQHLLFDSLTIGGGTPLLLSEQQLERLFQMARRFPFHEHAPAIVETSPGQTTEEKLHILKQYGVSRISIGVQSFHNEELSVLNRKHTVEQCHRALSLIGNVGFSCRNIDLIYGIPGQTEQSLQYSIDTALSFAPEELFLYPLYIKQGTGLYKRTAKDSAQTYRLYQFMHYYLLSHGYRQISMRRFVKEHFASSRSISQKSCGFEHTLSIGCGGRSYLRNLHFCTPYHIQQSSCLREIINFMQRDDFGKVSFGYLLNGDEMLRRFVIKNLLYEKGFTEKDYMEARQNCIQYGFEDFPKETGSVSEDFTVLRDFPVLNELRKTGLVTLEHSRIMLTEKGMGYSDAIGALFISKKVQERMTQWTEQEFI